MRRTLIGACIVAFWTGVAPTRCDAQIITATQVNPKTIRVVVSGKFEIDFSMRKGFGAAIYDLRNDPEKKRDLAPVRKENGILWVKAGYPPGKKADSWSAKWSQTAIEMASSMGMPDRALFCAS